MNNIFSLHSKTAIVTGGYGHLGAAISRGLLDFGAEVFVVGLSEEKFLNKFGNVEGSINFQEADIMSKDSLENAFQQIYLKSGKIDILFNNAVALKGGGVETLDDQDWLYTIDGVANSVNRSILAALPYMKKQNYGKIVNISSMYGMVSPDFRIYEDDECKPFLNPPHYGAAKAAVLQLTRYYAAYLAKHSIHVNAISPGPFPNEKIQQSASEFVKKLKNKNPLGKIGKPSDLVGVSILLSSGASDFITGQNFVVDGGWTII